MTSSTPASLSAQAQAWLARLPAPVRLHGVAAHAPELAESIAAVWHDEERTASLLEHMLSDTVHAMPVSIAAELLRLYEYLVCSRAEEVPSAPWELTA